MDGLKIAIVICIGLILAWAVYAIGAVAPAPAGTGCTVTFDAKGLAQVVCTNGLKMSCRP